MKFNINAPLLKACINRIQGGLGGITLAAQSIKIKAESGQVSLYTNNIKIGYTYVIGCPGVSEEGEAVVDGASLTRFINASVSEEITIYKEGDFLYIRDGRRKVNLGTIPSSEFFVPYIVEEIIAEVDLASFKIMLKSSVHMTSSNNTIFDGIYMDGKMVAATDQMKAVILPFESSMEDNIILTKEAAKEIMKMSSEEKISLRSNGSFLTIESVGEESTLSLSMQLVAGNYPDLNKFKEITNYSDYVTLGIEEAYSEINYISLISDNTEQVCRMSVSDEGTIVFEANAHLGTNKLRTELDFDLLSAVVPEENFVFNFKVSNMLSMLRSIKEFSEASFFDNSNFKIYFGSNERPIRLETDGLYQFLSAIRSFD